MRFSLCAVVLFLWLVPWQKTEAGELTGYVAIEHRQFFHTHPFPEQKNGSVPSYIFEPEYYHASEDRKHSFVAKVFLRYDPSDSERTHVDIRQWDWSYRASRDWEIRLGISRVFWGVAESRHLVDNINQVDAIEDIDDEDRFGMPMLQLIRAHASGSLLFMYLPYFRERPFPGRTGRVRDAFVIDTHDALYAVDEEEFYPNVAIRYEHVIGFWDIGIAQFHGIGREPRIQFLQGRLVPFYETIHDTSLNAQYTEDAWLWKLEGLYRRGQGRPFFAFTAGVEYTFFGLYEGAHDLGMLAEYHYDGRDSTAPAVPFDRDVFVGLRYAFNDVADTTFLGGVTLDMAGDGIFTNIEVARRLTEHWKIEFDMRLFGDLDDDTRFSFLNREDYAQLRLSYFF